MESALAAMTTLPDSKEELEKYIKETFSTYLFVKNYKWAMFVLIMPNMIFGYAQVSVYLCFPDRT